jgi:hypothetical protein
MLYNEQKKRGRPPKQNKQVKETIENTIKNNEMDLKKYSLVNTNIIGKINTTINKNIILHLKLNKTVITELETFILNYNNPKFNLNNIQNNNLSDDSTLFESSIGLNQVLDKTEINLNTDNLGAPTNFTNLTYNPSILIEPKAPQTQQVAPPQKISDNLKAIKRRNLIINSGIEYKIHKILNEFNNTEYPTSSPYVCWYDCHNFTGPPVGIPEKIIYNGDSFIFIVSGNFCSFNCAMRYLMPTNIDDYSCINNFIDNTNSDDKYDKIQMLEMLAHIELNTSLYTKIKLAPPRLSLKMFGGVLSIEEFRDNFNKLSQFHIYKYPIISIHYNLEETINMNNKTLLYSNNTTEDGSLYNYIKKLSSSK